MKKIILGALFAFIAFVACKKEADIPAIKFKFDVKLEQETLPEKGINESSLIKLLIKPNYKYSNYPLSYKVTSDKRGIIKKGDQVLIENEIYKADSTSIDLIYIGKEEGTHKVSINFFNDKGNSITKTVEIPYAKFDFSVSVIGVSETYQGENNDYKLMIVPQNPKENERYRIKFISYDVEDPNLEKSLVAFNGNKIEFNKEYEIQDISKEQIIRLNSFYSGNKTLTYKIVNSTFEKQEVINQSVNKATIVIKELNFNKLNTISSKEELQLKGIVVKTPLLSNNIQYKTWITPTPEIQTDGVESTNNVYQNYQLETGGIFDLKIKTIKSGQYTYNVQFKDEFGNETDIKAFDLNVSNKNFELEVTGGSDNIYQGDNISYNVAIKTAETNANEPYQIKLLSFDSSDLRLEKSKVYLDSNPININEWTSLSSRSFTLTTNAWNYGKKTFSFEVRNSSITKKYDVVQDVKKKEIYINSMEFNNDEWIIEEGKTVTPILKVIIGKNYNSEDIVSYKTWVTNRYDEENITNTKGSYNVVDVTNNTFTKPIEIKKVGEFEINLQLKNKYENESEIKKIKVYADKNIIEVSGNEEVTFNSICKIISVDCEKKQRREYDDPYHSYTEPNGTLEKYTGITQDIKVKLGGGHRLSKMIYYTKIKYDYNVRPYNAPEWQRIDEIDINDNKREIQIGNRERNVEDIFCAYIDHYSSETGEDKIVFITNKGFKFEKRFKFRRNKKGQIGKIYQDGEAWYTPKN